MGLPIFERQGFCLAVAKGLSRSGGYLQIWSVLGTMSAVYQVK